VLGAAGRERAFRFAFGLAARAVLGGEERVAGAADDLVLDPAEEALGAAVPRRHRAVGGEAGDRVVGRARRHEPQVLVALSEPPIAEGVRRACLVWSPWHRGTPYRQTIRRSAQRRCLRTFD